MPSQPGICICNAGSRRASALSGVGSTSKQEATDGSTRSGVTLGSNVACRMFAAGADGIRDMMPCNDGVRGREGDEAKSGCQCGVVW